MAISLLVAALALTRCSLLAPSRPAAACMFLWAVVCLALNNYCRATDESVMLYCGLPVAALAGVAIADFRSNRVWCMLPSALTNAWDVELKARCMLHDAIWGHHIARMHEPGVHTASQATAPDAPAAYAAPAAGASRLGQQANKPAAAPDSMVDDHDGEDQMQELRALIPQAKLQAVQSIYRDAALRLHRSAMVHAYAARFYGTYMGNRHMQFSHLIQVRCACTGSGQCALGSRPAATMHDWPAGLCCRCFCRLRSGSHASTSASRSSLLTRRPKAAARLAAGSSTSCLASRWTSTKQTRASSCSWPRSGS